MKIAIAGFGLEGKSNLEYFLHKFPEAEFVIFDEREKLEDVPTGVETVLGENAFAQIRGFDLVLRTAGLAPSKIGQSEKHWSATREFFSECAKKNITIIGVTGSKGKGTTCSFIYEILRTHLEKPDLSFTGLTGESSQKNRMDSPNKSANDDRRVFLVGNIGQPSLEILLELTEHDFVVYELSSFQLWDLEFSPSVAVMTMIEPDHLDVHENMADYVAAKSRIFEFQKAGNVAVYNSADALVKEIAENAAKKTGVILQPFPDEKFAHCASNAIASNAKQSSDKDNNGLPRFARNDGDWFYYSDKKLFPISVVKLPGKHNLLNACAAINATWNLTIPEAKIGFGLERDAAGEKIWQVKLQILEKGLSGFSGLPHRLKFVREIGEVKFYDDSIATTPGSVIAALKSFDEPKILIVGGHDKGADYTEMAQEISERNVRMVFAIGENRAKIAAAIRENSDVIVHELDYKKMNEIVREIWQNTEPGDVVILSPAAASFDMFRDYQERGEKFVAAVRSLE